LIQKSLFYHEMIYWCRIFSDVIGTKVWTVFLLAIHSHIYKRIYPPPPPPQTESGLKLVLNGNLKSLDNTQKPQRNCTFMNSASVQRRNKIDLKSTRLNNKRIKLDTRVYSIVLCVYSICETSFQKKQWRRNKRVHVIQKVFSI